LAAVLASPIVLQQIALLVTMSDYRKNLLELSFRGPYTLSDSMTLVHRLGPKNAARFINTVDPWYFPGEKTRASCLVERFLQGAIDKANIAGKMFNLWTEESLTEYLMSPLLVQKGQRPELIRKRGATRLSISSRAAVEITTVLPSGSPLSLFNIISLIPSFI
jgi:hypothetical protein